MKRLILMLLAMGLAIGLIVVVGCSDDEEQKPAGPTVGDPNDPEFQMASEFIGQDFIEHDFTLAMIAIQLIDSIPVPRQSEKGGESPFKATGIAQDIDSLAFEYSYSEYWHIFNLYLRLVEPQGDYTDTLIYAGIDSLRFSDDTGYVQYFEAGNSIEIRAHVDGLISTLDGYVEIMSDAAFDVDFLTALTIMIGGTSADSVDAYFEDADTSCAVSMTSNQTATGLTINLLSNDCPSAGTINVAATLDIDCLLGETPMQFSSAWNVLFAFSGTTITVTYTNGNTIWTITEQCGGSASPANIVRNLSQHLK